MALSKAQQHTVAMGLFYPAALGAAIAWWVQALMAWRVNSVTHPLPHPPGWALLFGLFFIGYHSRQFVARTIEGSSQYHWASFANDLVDCLALVLAFMCLGFAVPEYTSIDAFAVFVLAALIPIGALITDVAFSKDLNTWLRKPSTWLLRLVAVVFAGWGVTAIGVDDSSAFGRLGLSAVLPLIGLLALLLLYLLLGHLFRGDRQNHTILNPGRRAIANSLVGVAAFLFILQRMPFIPPLESKAETEWVSVGTLDSLASGAACSSSPDISRKMSAIIERLRARHPIAIKVIGSADPRPPRGSVAEEHGNNTGLARDRVNCIVGWLATSGELPGVEYRPDSRAPGDFANARARDRSGEVLALVRSSGEPAVRQASKP